MCHGGSERWKGVTNDSRMDTQRAILASLLGGPRSLADLGAATGTSLPTLRRAVQELQRQRWVNVVGRESATGGRPANLFGVDDSTHTVVGVHLVHPGMRLVATDLLGNLLDAHGPGDVHELELEAVHGVVLQYLERLRERYPQRSLLGLALATPGYVDPQSGTVLTIGRVPRWNNLPICDRLREATGLRVTIGNDVDALATAEFGVNGGHRTYAYAGVGEGVKFSMFLHGRPYVGPFGNAGLVSLGLLAGGAGQGQAEVLTVNGLVAAFLERSWRHDNEPAGHAGVRALSDMRARYRAVLALAESGDPDAAAVVATMVELLGAQVASFVHLIQPEMLVIGGALAGAPERVLADVESALRRRLPRLLDNNLIVRRARMVDDHAAALGATRSFVHRFLHEDVTPLVRAAA